MKMLKIYENESFEFATHITTPSLPEKVSQERRFFVGGLNDLRISQKV